MGNENIPEAVPTPLSARIFRNRKAIFISLGTVAFLIVAAFLALQGYLIAATVNGSPVSRLSVVAELEKRSGKEVLDMLITEKLIMDEARKRNIVVAESELMGEIQTVESQVSAMGSTLQDQLKQQGMTEQDMRNQLITHLTIEKLLGERAEVSEEEIDAYIKEQETVVPAEGEAEARTMVKERIREDKVSQQAGPFIAELRARANIKYNIDY